MEDFNQLSVPDLVKIYARASVVSKAVMKEARERAAKADEIAARAKLAMLGHLDRASTKTMSGEWGRVTATERTVVSAKPGEWDQFFAWVRAENTPEMVQKRPATRALREWMDQHEGQVPPGIAVSTERSVSVHTGSE